MAAEEKWYFTKKQLENSPSRKCDIDSDKELSYRQQAANFIQDVGQRLQVSQLCINTAIVYMHRFYVFHSFTQFHRYSMASAALFLAAKVEEQPRKLEHVIKVAHVCLHKESEGSTPAPDVKSEQYAQAAHELVFNENVLLQTLGFDVVIDHPHTHVVRCCHLVKGIFVLDDSMGIMVTSFSGRVQPVACKDLAQTSYFLASNSLHLTTMCLQYKPTVVACFCIHLACKWSNWEIPPSSEGKPWFAYVDESVTIEMLDELTKEFISIYNKCPSRLKKKIQSMSASLGQSSSSSGSTPNSSSGASVNHPPLNCNSPMNVDNKKLQAPQHTKELQYHTKVHHGQPKPGLAHPHRPLPHDPTTYNEYKEKKERERQQNMGAPGTGTSHNSLPSHHKQPAPLNSQDNISKHQTSSSNNSQQQNHKHGIPPGSNIPHNRNPHHRSSSANPTGGNISNLDPKLKMHNQMHPHSNRPPSSVSSNQGQGHPRIPPTGDLQHRAMEREQMHRDPNQIRNVDGQNREQQHSGSNVNSGGVSRDYRDPYRDYNRDRMNRTSDITAPRELLPPGLTSAAAGSSNSGTSASSNVSAITSERELLKEQQMRERHNAGGHANMIETNKDHLFRSDVFERPPAAVRPERIENNRDSLSINNIHSKLRTDLFNKDSNNSVSDTNNSNKDSDKIRYEQKQYKLDPKNIGNNVPQLANMKLQQHDTNKHTVISRQKELTDSVVNKSHSSQKKPTQLHTDKSNLNKPPSQSNIMGSSVNQPPLLQQKKPTSSYIPQDSVLTPNNNESRNGNVEEINKRNESETKSVSPPAPSIIKQKSIFSPEKELPKTPTKKSKAGKTPPSASKSENMIPPPVLSPFGSPPPPLFNTPNSKNRNRTSSSSSEPELLVVIDKLEHTKGYQQMLKTGMTGLKLPKEEKDRKTSTISPEKTKSEPDKNKLESIKIKEDRDIKIKEESNNKLVNGLETTDPTVISNLLKEVAPINHLSVMDNVKKEEDIERIKEKESIPSLTIDTNASNVPNTSNVPDSMKKSDHHKSEKKKKKDKHKHKDKDRSRDDKEKKKKHKDKDRERHKTKEQTESNQQPTLIAPLKITIAKDKITPPTSTEMGSGLKIKIPKERIKTETIQPSIQQNSGGGLKIKISKDKIVENLSASSGGVGNETLINSGGTFSTSGSGSSSHSGRKRERSDNTSESTAPPVKISKSNNSVGYSRSSTSSSSFSDNNRQNGRNISSYNNKQVSLGEGGQVGGVAVASAVLQQQAQWSTQVNKLAESKYHSKVSSGGSNKQPPT